MKVSTRTEYGIRLLIQLARHDGDGPVSLAGVARREKLPHAYLEQLVGQLRRAGLVSATRGQSGGYQLAGPLLEMPCAGADNLEVCDRPQTCSVHDLFQRVHESLDLALGSTTLAEVAASAGGPPYPPAVRKRRIAEHAARQAVPAAALARDSAPTYAGATTTDS